MAENKKTKKVKSKKEKNKKTQISKENEKHLKKAKKIRFKDKHPRIALILKIILLLILVAIVVGAGIVIGVVYGAFGEEFEITKEELTISMMNSFVVDQEGNVLAELSGEEGKRTIITLDEMSPYLVDAYVSIEDERFYEHKGVDLYRTAGAIFTYVTNGGNSSFGGSTITQQLVKNFTQDDEDEGIEGIIRKVKEWAKAYQVEKMLSKPQILELYLNLIFVGGQGNYGVETGANYYFSKSASELTLLECAFLAGINSNPNLYNPYGEYGYGVYETKTNRINSKVKVVLGKMLELGKINQEDYDAAIKELSEQGMKFTKGTSTNNYSYHTDALINQVIKDVAEQKGISISLAQKYVYTSGLKIYSTQSSSIQQKTEEAVNNALILESEYEDESGKHTQTSQSAMVVIDHKTGYVVACVGGIGEKESRGLNRATQSKRQPGSAIKPIAVVAPGLEEKIITAATIYNDSYTKFKVGTSIYDPKNWNYYRGNVTIRQSIETSQNVPFVKVMKELGVEKSIEYLEKMGITSLNHESEGLALAIGGVSEGISPLEMAAAYATIANDGVYIEPIFYTKVEDMDGNVVLTPQQKTERVISETTSAILKDVLKEPVEGAGGSAKVCAISGIDVAAKTGTTNGNKDRWLCGFTNYYTAAVWYGFDQPAEILSSGVKTANSIWATAMKSIHEGLEASKFTLTSNVITATICKDSGKLASDTCYNTYSEIFEIGTIPESCEGHTGYKICNETNLLANQYCTNTSTIYKTYLVEKEKNGDWETPSNTQENEIPTEYCTVHKKVEVVKPTEKEEEIEETEKEENTDKDSEQNTEEENPDTETDNENNENSGNNESTGNNNEGNEGNSSNNTSDKKNEDKNKKED